jgi:hypothetical protein
MVKSNGVILSLCSIAAQSRSYHRIIASKLYKLRRSRIVTNIKLVEVVITIEQSFDFGDRRSRR